MPPILLERLLTGRFPQPQSPNILILNAWNILLSLLLAGTLFVIAGRYTSQAWRRAAFVLSCLFATYFWYYQRAQESEIYHALFFALAYECLLRSLQRQGLPSTKWLVLAWFWVAMLVLTRVFYVVLIPWTIAAWAGGALLRRPRRQWMALLGKLPPLIVPPLALLALLGWINYVKFGSPLSSGYHIWRPEDHLPTGRWIDGAFGMMFTCHWSIFVYFPVLILALGGMRRFAAEHELDAILIFSAFALSMAVLCKIPTWRGEWTYGPRYLIFIAPPISLPALYFADVRPRSAGAWALVLGAAGLLGFSAWLQLVINENTFWFFYAVELPLNGVMDREMTEYLYDRPEGLLFTDLYAHRDHLDQTPLFRHLEANTALTPGDVELYRKRMLLILHLTNLYWWPPPAEPKIDAESN